MDVHQQMLMNCLVAPRFGAKQCSCRLEFVDSIDFVMKTKYLFYDQKQVYVVQSTTYTCDSYLEFSTKGENHEVHFNAKITSDHSDVIVYH